MILRLIQPPKVSKEAQDSIKKYGEISKIDQIKNFKIKQNEIKITFSNLKDKKGLEEYLQKLQINYRFEEIGQVRNAQNQVSGAIFNPSFYYFKDDRYGKGIESYKLTKTYEELFKIDNAETFELTTTYPGLLIGSGYNHQKLKGDNDDFQLGFFFDHTTGLPVISGSSIKGVIRSIFPDNNDKYKDSKEKFLEEELKINNIEDMKKELFYNTDVIYYDAYIKATANENGKIFGSDYITPHKNYKDLKFKNGLLVPDEMSEPNLIKFLKILPEVTFIFQFKATDTQVELFEKIIKYFGVGAKTNVGYGQFVSAQK